MGTYPELSIPAVFNLIDRLNKITRVSLAGAEGERLIMVEEDDGEPPASALDAAELERLEPGALADVIAVDSSAIAVAYTERKWYLVFSVGLATRSGGRYALPYVHRLGPYIADVSRRDGDDQQTAARRLREYVEGFTILDLIHADGPAGPTVVLVDGSLSGLPEADCTSSRERGTFVLGISKTTRFVSSMPGSMPAGRGYFTMSRGPCYFTMAARLDEYGVPLRVDAVDIEGLQMLLSSDVMVRGYPDTLRLAHYASLISRSEEMAAKAMLAGQGASLAKPVDRRDLILGVLKVRG